MHIYVGVVALVGLLTALCIVLQSHYIAHIINEAFLARQSLAQLTSALSLLLFVLIGRAALIYWPFGQDNNGFLPDASPVFAGLH